ncbi:MAG: PadR family transcriptional regulator [Acidobacteria bacterium]|nr:MAG: PadR family transcriptional regulator [Acidobacteriota bacterium]
MTQHHHLGTFELAVMLALIRLGDDAYAIPISNEIEARSGRAVTIASVYSTLGRLEMKGLVSSEMGEPTPERGGRAKKYFRVTAKGLREIRDTQRILIRLWHGLRELGGSRA